MTVGQSIRAARERKGLSTAAVASTTRILHATIKAIEADDYDALPSPVYVRGFVRSIAVVLEMNVEHTLIVFDRQVAMPGPGEGDEEYSLAVSYGEDDVEPPQAPVKWGPGLAAAVFLLIVGIFMASAGEDQTPQAEASTADVTDGASVK